MINKEKNMLPEWMQEEDNYIPDHDNSAFIIKSLKALGQIMATIQFQSGQEKYPLLPPLAKLLVLLFGILFLSLTHSPMILVTYFAMIQLYVCMQAAKEILSIYKGSLIAALFATILFLPAMILHPEGIPNHLQIIAKVFINLEMISIYNHTTQWNHITRSLRKLHLPGIFIFTLDITLKYIVLLGNVIKDLLTSLQLRSVGKNNKKYQSIGGVMGVTFLRSTEMSQQMYEAMQCRGFTDD